MRENKSSRYPEYLRKRTKRHLVLVLIVAASPFAYIVFSIFLVSADPVSLFWKFLVPIWIVQIVAHSVNRRDRRWLHKRVKENDYMVCDNCAYLLVGIGESGVCPECGQAFEVESLQKTWRYFENNLLLP